MSEEADAEVERRSASEGPVPEESSGAGEPRTVDGEGSSRGRWDRLKAIGRWALLGFGVVAVVWLVWDAGPAKVWATLLRAGVWLPAVLFFEICFAMADIFALRRLYGSSASKVPGSEWVRSGLMAYGIMILLPAGRAGGEVVRAATLAPYVGGAYAAAAAARLQAVTLLGNTLISIPCYAAIALASGPTSRLALLVGANGLVTGLIATVLLYGARFSSLGGWLGKRVAAVGKSGREFDKALKDERGFPALPTAAAFGGRVAQSALYGVAVFAVGGTLTLSSALIAQGIHLVGAGLGDMVPNQVGVTEGAYRIFADSLGFAGQPERAIGIALVHRICQFALAGASLLITALWKPASTSAVAAEGASASPLEEAEG